MINVKQLYNIYIKDSLILIKITQMVTHILIMKSVAYT